MARAPAPLVDSSALSGTRLRLGRRCSAPVLSVTRFRRRRADHIFSTGESLLSLTFRRTHGFVYSKLFDNPIS